MKKSSSFLFLVLGIFLGISSCYSSDELMFDLELETGNVGKNEVANEVYVGSSNTSVNKEQLIIDGLISDFYDFYKSAESQINDLKILRKKVNMDEWVFDYFKEIAKTPEIGITCFPNNYHILAELIKCSAQTIITSEEYSYENEELFCLVERLDPIWHQINAIAKKF